MVNTCESEDATEKEHTTHICDHQHGNLITDPCSAHEVLAHKSVAFHSECCDASI